MVMALAPTEEPKAFATSLAPMPAAGRGEMAGHVHVQSPGRVVRRAAKQAQARRASSFCCMHGDAWRKQLEDGRRAAKTPLTVGHKDAENDGAGKDPGEIPAKQNWGRGEEARGMSARIAWEAARPA